ncbi:hypothetical protein B0J11DRAFT_437136, partial [Dendryphion nanum]
PSRPVPTTTRPISNTMPQSSPYLSTVLNSTPSSPATTPKRLPHSNLNAPPPASSSAFTPAQQSLQARNKPFHSPQNAESYEQRKQRAEAALILESVEMLLWFSSARNESISQTRKYYQDIVLGLSNPDSIVWREEYEVPLEQRTPSHSGSPARNKGKEKVKKRI